MQMTPGEITRRYRESKNKSEQIKVLAELNCCDKAEIEKILKAAGHELPQPRGRKPTKTAPKTAPVKKIKPKTVKKAVEIEENVDFTQCEAIEPVEEEIEDIPEVDYPEEEPMPVSVWETLKARIMTLDSLILEAQKEKDEIEQYIELHK